MQTNYLILEDSSNQISHVPCALHIRAPASEQRNPTHFVLVIDTSDSMADQSRLENVKHSASLVLNFLGPNDLLSLITFGEDSTIHCSSVACTSEQKTVIQGLISKIHPDGCTNLSAAILNVKKVVTNTAIKTGVLLLTDGHANRGVFSADKVLDMFNNLHTQIPALSFTVVGYGTEHNAVLMKAIAENTSGAYCIVENLEGAATVIGNTIGGLFSCSSQVVKLKCSVGTELHESHKVDANGCIEIGDIYDESEQIILFNVPKESLGKSIQLTGSTLSSMDNFTIDIAPTQWSSGQSGPLYTAVDLTRLRYRCSELFKKLTQRERIDTEIAHFRSLVFADAYNGNPVAEMLRVECVSLETAARTNVNVAHLYQHVAFNTLGRGTTQTIQPDDNPNEPDMVGSLPQQMASPMSSRLQRRVTNLMTTMTGGGVHAEEAEAAAQEFSQLNPS
jgi:Mg-chelatase subunit ChlD